MKKLHFSITIHAPKGKVWHAMLEDKTYRQWTEAFGSGSHFIGSWEEGTDIKFLAPNNEGGVMGMVSRIKTNRPYQYISIEHLGMIQNGQEDTSSEAVKGWIGALENYTFQENNGSTELTIDTDTIDEYQKMFEDIWPKALQKLKEIAETPSFKVTVETLVNAPLEKVWACWTKPEHITKWCFASDDWEAPSATNDLRTGGRFTTRMSAKDGSSGFNFGGTYTDVKDLQLIEYNIDGDGRHVKIQFEKLPDGVKVTETFEIENVNSAELQRSGWQSILDNFKKYTESN